MPAEIGDGDEQVERLPVRQQPRPARRGRHRVKRVEDQSGEQLAAERRFEPARADEVRQLGADLVARSGLDQLVDVVATAPRRHPGDR